MTVRELYRPTRKLHAFRAAIYPLNIAILYTDTPTRMYKVWTYHQFIDSFNVTSVLGTLKAFSVTSVPLHSNPLTFEVDQIKIVTEGGTQAKRVCTLTCDQLHWEKEYALMSRIPDIVEKRLWDHLKVTHQSLFDTFH